MKERINEKGKKVFFVGGYVRDKFISNNYLGNISSNDIDFIYEGNVEKLVDKLKLLRYKIFPIKIQVGIYRSIIENRVIDIASMKGKNIEEDLYDRDFTINAIAMDMENHNIIDPFNGINDINHGVVKQVSETSIKMDPVRILRGVRFCIKYNFVFEKNTLYNIKKYSYLISGCAKERITNELLKIVESDINGKAFQILDDCNVLKYMFPYIDELKLIGKCKYHRIHAFYHMNLVYKVFKKVINGEIQFDHVLLKKLNNYISNFKIEQYIALSAFLHDIGKYNCYKKVGNKVSFYGHEKEGALIVKKLCKKMLLPRKSTEIIVKVIEGHMKPLEIFKSDLTDFKDKCYNFFSQYNEHVPYILILSFCDIYATEMLLDENNGEKFQKFINKLFEEYEVYLNIINKKIVSGYEIAKYTGAKGSEIKEILGEIERLRYLGNIKTKKEIMEYMENKKVLL